MAVRVYIACRPWKNAVPGTRLHPFEDLQNVTYVIILNNSTRVCDARIISKLTGLDLHGSAIKWVAGFGRNRISIRKAIPEMDLGSEIPR